MGKLNITKFREALKDSMGSITTIAKKCQVERITVYRLIEKYPQLKQELIDEVNRITDLVESNLKVLALKKNFKAMKFYLETKGKDRGYGRSQQIDMKSENKTEIDLSKFQNYLDGNEEEEGKEETDESGNSESNSESNK